jgi:hypothetical protein
MGYSIVVGTVQMEALDLLFGSVDVPMSLYYPERMDVIYVSFGRKEGFLKMLVIPRMGVSSYRLFFGTGQVGYFYDQGSALAAAKKIIKEQK